MRRRANDGTIIGVIESWVVLAFFEGGGESRVVASMGIGLFMPLLVQLSQAGVMIRTPVIVVCATLVTGIRGEEESVCGDEDGCVGIVSPETSGIELFADCAGGI
jgi:hypothetical protein